MRLTRAAEYAIRCIIYLSKIGTQDTVSKKEIAKNAEIPESFLSKIAQDLSKAGLIEIFQGSKGSYRLVKEPKEITLLEVVEIMVGRIYLNECIGKPSVCPKFPHCLVHKVWDEASDHLRDNLRSVTFEDLSSEDYCTVHNP